MHLCVSSKHKNVFQFAQQLVEDLLTAIYKEYKAFCLERQIAGDFNLKIKIMNRRRRHDSKSSKKKGQARIQRSKKHKSFKLSK